MTENTDDYRIGSDPDREESFFGTLERDARRYSRAFREEEEARLG